MNGPITVIGGKSRLAKSIIALLPDHVCYAEPFSGGAQVFFHKPCSKVEVLNDLDGEVVNFFRVCQAHHEELIRCLRLSSCESEMVRTLEGERSGDPHFHFLDYADINSPFGVGGMLSNHPTGTTLGWEGCPYAYGEGSENISLGEYQGTVNEAATGRALKVSLEFTRALANEVTETFATVGGGPVCSFCQTAIRTGKVVQRPRRCVFCGSRSKARKQKTAQRATKDSGASESLKV